MFLPKNTNALPEYVDAIPENTYEFRSDYLHLWIDLDLKLMYSEWLRKPTIQEYQQACKLISDMVKKHTIAYWILDSNHLVGLAEEEQRKIIRQLAPAFLVSSLKKVARVIAQGVDHIVLFEEVAEELKRTYPSTIEVERFFSFKDALDWIGSIRD